MNLNLKEAYMILENLQARLQWLEDNPDDFERENEKGHISNIINKLNKVII